VLVDRQDRDRIIRKVHGGRGLEFIWEIPVSRRTFMRLDDDYFSASPLGIDTLAAHAQAHAHVSLVDMCGNRRGQIVAPSERLAASHTVHHFGDGNQKHSEPAKGAS
jgi:hypothetical protein